MTDKTGIELPESDGESPSRKFLGVVPIAQAGHGEQEVIILGALERYDHDASISVALRFAPGHPHTQTGDEAQWLYPVPVMTVDDDLGSAYRVRQKGGGGSLYVMRSDYVLTPGIPERARKLEITIESIYWEDTNTGETRAVTPGPWRFDVDLSRQLDATPSH
jgi:hypothetical protein